MGYAKEIGTALAETLEELVLSEDTGIPLNEIRDLNSLQTAMSKFGKKHPHYHRLQSLHARKTAIEARKEHRMARQREIASSHGYRQVGKNQNMLRHRATGHTLSLNGGGWSHQKAGVKRTNGTHRGLSAIRGLSRHLAKIHG